MVPQKQSRVPFHPLRKKQDPRFEKESNEMPQAEKCKQTNEMMAAASKILTSMSSNCSRTSASKEVAI
jgi:hypothetical protein